MLFQELGVRRGPLPRLAKVSGRCTAPRRARPQFDRSGASEARIARRPGVAVIAAGADLQASLSHGLNVSSVHSILLFSLVLGFLG